jgi:hypothetical protein
MTKRQKEFIESALKNINIIQNEVTALLGKENVFQQAVKPLLQSQNSLIALEVSRSHYQSNLTAIRRQLGILNGEISLLSLLTKLMNSNKWITEKWYAEMWLKDYNFAGQDPIIMSFTKSIPNSEFKRNFGADGYLDKSIVEKDVKELADTCTRIKQYTNENITHTKKIKKQIPISESEYKTVLSTIDKLTTKYILLLKQIGITLTPTIQ